MHYCRPFWIGHFEVSYERDENMENRHLTFNPLPVRGGEEIRHPPVFAKLPPSSDYGETGDRALNHNWDMALAKVKPANSANRAWHKSPAQRQ